MNVYRFENIKGNENIDNIDNINIDLRKIELGGENENKEKIVKGSIRQQKRYVDTSIGGGGPVK